MILQTNVDPMGWGIAAMAMQWLARPTSLFSSADYTPSKISRKGLAIVPMSAEGYKCSLGLHHNVLLKTVKEALGYNHIHVRCCVRSN